MNTLFEAHDLRKCYDDITALHVPFFRMEKGETVALIGRNGSGKSTLLRLLAFLEKPTSGTLIYTGNQTDPRREVTLLLQEPYLMKASVFWNVTLGLRLRGMGVREQREGYAHSLLAVGFSDPDSMATRGPGELSGGERQRIALASRLILSPSVLLLDEPTSNVDAASEKAILNVVRTLRSRGVSIVCATHDRDLPAALEAREIHIVNERS